MATLRITKISAVIFITPQGSTNPKSYFGATGSFQASDDNTTILIKVTSAGKTVPDEFIVPYASLTVGTSTPTTLSSALILLNAIFGT